MTPLIYSVPHTGTKFTRSLILGEEVSRHYDQIPFQLDENTIVSPIRNPRDTWQTWAQRNTPSLGNDEVRLFHRYLANWLMFNQYFLEHPGLLILPIDTPERRIHLEYISERLGKSFETDWTPVGSAPHSHPRSTLNISAVYRLEVVKEFYAVDT